MMRASEIESLCTVLARQESLATSYRDARAYAAAAGFLRFIRSHPQLASLLTDFVEETHNVRRSLIRNSGDLLTAIETLRERRPVLRSAGQSELWFNESYQQIAKEIRNQADSRVAFRACQQLEAVFDDLAAGLREHLADAAGTDLTESKALFSELERQRQLYRRWLLQLQINSETLPGEAYLALAKSVGVLLPQILTDHRGRTLVFDDHLDEAEELWKQIEQAKRLGPPEHDLGELDVCSLVRRVSVALQAALTQRYSQLSLIRRFAARCESFEAQRVREALLRSKGRTETELTLEFARFMFDAGYNPVLNPDVSGLKPDVVQVSEVPAMYVEAKQYEDATAAELRAAVAQVRDTWQRFANRFDTPEAILLIFRVGGRNLDLPPELPTSLGRLILQVVNVAPISISGSRAKAPLTLAAEDLLGNA
jgi:hypothetical protein